MVTSLLLICFAALTVRFVPVRAQERAEAPLGYPGKDEPWEKVKAGYWPSYASEMFPVSELSTDLYTHMYFAFASVNSTTFRVEIPPDKVDAAREFTSLATKTNSSLKTLMSIGGANGNSTVFSQMASNFSSRQEFIISSISLARAYGFHGIDVDWEYPRSNADMSNLALLFTELRNEINKEAERTETMYPSRLLLTAAVYYSSSVMDILFRYKYPVDRVSATLDWANIMCFDYHGFWEPYVTGEHSALNDSSSQLSSSYGIQSWLDDGLPPHQAVMGLASYGRTWLLANSSLDHSIGAPARSAGPAKANGSSERGVLFLGEIEEFIRDNNATVVDDEDTASAYAFANDFWVGFDNSVSIEKKVTFLKSKDLRGYFFWTASFDREAVLALTASETLDRVPEPPPTLENGRDSAAQSLSFQRSSFVALVIFVLHLLIK